MPIICCVFGCGSRSTKEKPVSFHGFPKNERLISKWKYLLKIGNKLKWSSARVCEHHFSLLQYDSFDTRRLKRNAFPDRNLPKRPSKHFNASDLPPKRKRKSLFSEDYFYESVTNLECSKSSDENITEDNIMNIESQTNENDALKNDQESQPNLGNAIKTFPLLYFYKPPDRAPDPQESVNEKVYLICSTLFDDLGREEEVEYCGVSCEHTERTEKQADPIPGIDERLLNLGGILAVGGLKQKSFTYLCGLSKRQFDVVYSLCIFNQNEWPYYRISLKDQLLLTLIKYRHNWEYRMIGIIFKIREGTAQDIFMFWTKLLYNRMESIDFWHLRSRKDGEYVAILDCTEVAIEKPAAPDLQQATFSKYKNTNTLKTLVAIDEQGVVLFVSDVYGGCVSDNRIVEMSGIVDQFSEGDYILADRGFEQIDVLSAKGVILNRPPNKRGPQLSEPDVAKTRVIASRRIDVERVIGYAKTYKILKNKVKYSLFPIMDMVIKILFKLTNIRKPICKIKTDRT